MNDLQQLRIDLDQTINNLTDTAKRLKISAREAANKRSDYERLKSGYKIQIAAEDELSGKKARTVPLIEALYRSKFAIERLEANLAESDYETDVHLYKGIMAKLNALQSLGRMIESEMKLGVNFQ